PIDDYAFHGAARFGVDKLAGGAVVGKICDVIEIDKDQVRLVARPDGAKLAIEPGGACVAQRRVAEHLMRKSGPRLRLADSRQQEENLHGLDFVLDADDAAVVATQP